MKIGDKVYHVDYPNVEGQVVGQYRSSELGAKLFLVRWEGSTRCSRHIVHALKRVAK